MAARRPCRRWNALRHAEPAVRAGAARRSACRRWTASSVAEQIAAGPELRERDDHDALLGGATRRCARCRELGIAAYLTKPVRQADLLDAIRRRPGSRRSRVEPTRAGHRGIRCRETPASAAHPAGRGQCGQPDVVASGCWRSAGHAVVVAGNGRRPSTALGARAFDVVLMDVQMPEMDGLKPRPDIREKEIGTRAPCPIVALTAHARQGDRERCLAAGMDAHLAKPFNVRRAVRNDREAPAHAGQA